MNENQLLNVEASKLVKEFAIWMIAIQSAAIGFLLSKGITPGAPLAFKGSLLVFGVSVVAALLNLGGLPWIVVRLNDVPKPNLYQMPLGPETGHLSLGVMLWIQEIASVIALALLIYSLI